MARQQANEALRIVNCPRMISEDRLEKILVRSTDFSEPFLNRRRARRLADFAIHGEDEQLALAVAELYDSYIQYKNGKSCKRFLSVFDEMMSTHFRCDTVSDSTVVRIPDRSSLHSTEWWDGVADDVEYIKINDLLKRMIPTGNSIQKSPNVDAIRMMRRRINSR